MGYVKETTHAKFMVRDHIGRNVNEPSPGTGPSGLGFVTQFCSDQPSTDGEIPQSGTSSGIYRETTAMGTDIAAQLATPRRGSKMGWHV